MISLLLPTRNRPNNVKRFCDSVYDTLDTSNVRAGGSPLVQIIIRVDEDDPTKEVVQTLGCGWVIVGKRQEYFGNYWNDCADLASGDIMMLCGDDLIFRTHGWNLMVEEAFKRYEDRIVFVYGRDGIKDEELGTHGFLHRNWVKTLGYFTPRCFYALYNDTWQNDLADRVGRKLYLPDMYVEHMHPFAGKGPEDAGYTEMNNRSIDKNEAGIWEEASNQRQRDAEKLKMFIAEFKK